MTLNTTRSRYVIFYYYARVPNFTPCRTKTNHFQVISHSVTRAPNDRNITLNTTRPNVPHVFDTSFNISEHVLLLHVHVLLLDPGPKFQSVSLYAETFSSHRPYWDNCTNDPTMTLTRKRSNVPHICDSSALKSQISIHFAVRPTIFELQLTGHFETSVVNDSKNDLKKQGQTYPIYILLVTLSSKFQAISLYRKPFSR